MKFGKHLITGICLPSLKTLNTLLNLHMANENTAEDKNCLAQPSIPYCPIKLDEGHFPTADSQLSFVFLRSFLSFLRPVYFVYAHVILRYHHGK